MRARRPRMVMLCFSRSRTPHTACTELRHNTTGSARTLGKERNPMKRLSLILLAVLCLTDMAVAQDKYPSRPVKVIVPYAPGGATDIVARIVGDAFQKMTGQGFVVLNKPGAFGMLAIDEMVKAAPDGYTIMIGNVSTNAITPILYGTKMSFDYRRSVAAVTNLIDVPA